MSTYSADGYRLAVMQRTGRTILVEGPSDQAAMNRMLLQHTPSQRGAKPRVDTPHIVNDERMSGMGFRDRVIHVAAIASTSDKFLALVDRDWEDFCLDTFVESEDAAQCGTPPVLKTRGNAIENYLLSPTVIVGTIKSLVSDPALAELILRIESLFREIQEFSLSYSIVAKKNALLSRLPGLLRSRHLEFEGFNYKLSNEFVPALESRGLTSVSAIDFLKDQAKTQALIRSSGVSDEILKWNCHGHLGYEATWSCVGKLARDCGIATAAAERLEGCSSDGKMIAGFNLLAEGDYDRVPLDEIAKWAWS